jgi:type II secretory pathway predicted ATPase ExeA
MNGKDTVLTHFGFSRMPFGKDVSIDQIFPNKSLAETTAMLSLGLDCEDIMLITGVIGCGKSLLLRRAARDFDPDRYQLIYLRGNVSTASELYKLVLRGMQIEPPHSFSKSKSRFFTAVCEAVRKPIVVLDDAQDAHPDTLLALKAMTNFESDSQNRLTFILVGQPELATVLSLSHFESVRERIRLAVRIAPMNLQETCAYIDHALSIVDRSESLFSDDAKAQVFKRTHGVARKINTVCYQAIINAAIEKRTIIDSQNLPSDLLTGLAD